ncbi:MAG: biotin/lipoyl-binding protein [Candidatus Dadabacteria bacterium]|nr:biotin/lipoyl-binding protein [Candidatus Dadabacteria bacterium]
MGLDGRSLGLVEVSGVYVENNQFIEEGQKLFSLDPRPYEYTVEQLRAGG